MRWTCAVAPTNSMLISILFLALAISAAHADFKVRPVRLHGDAPYSHRRLYGIRRLKVVRPLVTKPVAEVAQEATIRRHEAAKDLPPDFASYQGYVPRAQIPPRLSDSRETETVPRILESSPIRKSTSVESPLSMENFDEEKRKRIEARWKRLGINMRTIQYPIRRVSSEKSSEMERLSRYSKFVKHEKKESAEKEIEDISAMKDEIRVAATPDTRKSVPSVVGDKDEAAPPRRPRIHGPLLSVVPNDGDARETGYGLSTGSRQQHHHHQQQLYRSSEVPTAPLAVMPPRFASPDATPSTNSNYHSRTTPVFKSYKYTQKLSQRPRLRIRRPGEKSISENSIQEDPNLTPFQNSARSRFGYGNHGGANGPIPYHRTIRPSPSSHSREVLPTRPSSPSSHSREVLPTTETIEITTTLTSTTTTTEAATTTATEAVPPTEAAESGESGAGFGFGPSELPPELANVGFGIGGNGINFNMPVKEAPSSASKSSEAKPKRPKQRKQPNPEIFKEGEPLVIPQNSGLRPVAPPKEFMDGGFGFGSGTGSGSIGGGGGGSGFGGGSGGGSGDTGAFGGGGGGGSGGGGNTGSGLSAGAASAMNPEVFTGDSALTPSHGPTGDGYGPPIFPGGAVPPPVPAVGLGGAAAGKSPYAAMIEPTENPPTTVKPSALLSVLNKADQGINQAISHFEQRSPLETAAIDILEVALGSTKLDSQAKLLGHVDRTIGLDNLQRIQRWANTAGAMDVFKEEVVKLMKNFEPPEDVFPTLPPQFEYLFKSSGR